MSVHPLMMYRSSVHFGGTACEYLDGMTVHLIMMYRSWVHSVYRVSKYLDGISVHPLMMYSSCVYLGYRVSKYLSRWMVSCGIGTGITRHKGRDFYSSIEFHVPLLCVFRGHRK